MKPVIYEYRNPKTGRVDGYLVDRDSAFSLADENGKPRTHYTRAVEIGNLTTESVRLGVDEKLVHPHPCLFRQHKKMDLRPVEDRGIHPRAAEVLLHLAGSFTNTQVDFARNQITIGNPASRGTTIGWDKFKFLAAWKWSHWKAHWMKGDLQHHDMKILGYLKSTNSLRAMLSEMGLARAGKG